MEIKSVTTSATDCDKAKEDLIKFLKAGKVNATGKEELELEDNFTSKFTEYLDKEYEAKLVEGFDSVDGTTEVIEQVVALVKDLVDKCIEKLTGEAMHNKIILGVEKLLQFALGRKCSIWIEIVKETVEMLLHEI